MSASEFVIRRKGTIIYDLMQEAPDLLPFVPQHAKDLVAEFRSLNEFPAARKVATFDDGVFFKPHGHVRAFYQRLQGVSGAMDGVIACKGSEVWSDDLGDTARAMANGRSCLNKSDFFILTEHKVPVALLTHEALSDARKGQELFRAVQTTFGEAPLLPLPLLVVQWPRELVDRYCEIVLPTLSETTRSIVERAVTDGFAEYIYYFPRSPLRLRHVGPQAPELLSDLSKTMARVDQWVTLFTKILCAGYLPAVLSQPINCCVMDQNLCIEGGIVDVDNVQAIEEDPRMFGPNLLASVQMLCHSLFVYFRPVLGREITREVLRLYCEFGNTLHAMAFFPHVWRMVAEKIRQFVAAGIKPNDRVAKAFGAPNGQTALLQIFEELRMVFSAPQPRIEGQDFST